MIKGLLRTAVTAALVLIFALCAGIAEETFVPPSPEPPPASVQGRPTPAPTAVPEATVIDHVHWPDEYKNFTFMEGKKLFEIWFPNIRDSDEALLLYDGEAWLLDCADRKYGARGAKMLEWLGIDEINVLLNSHMHHDHIDGLEVTAEVALIKEIRICFPPALTESGLRMLQTAETWGIPVKEYKNGDVFTMGDGAVKMQILQNEDENLDINNRSALTKITFGNRSILFMADMEWLGQEAMIKWVDPALLKCDIVKYPHHGKSDMHSEFFEAVGAQLAVVTSLEGRKDAGQYALARRCLPAVFTASKDSCIHLVTDGEYWLVERVKMKTE